MKNRKLIVFISLILVFGLLTGCTAVDKAIDSAADKFVDNLFHPENKGKDKDRPTLAALPDSYDERLKEQWQDADEDSYIWTITVNDVDVINIFGLCEASYEVNMSASHIGDDMYGAYFGKFGFNYNADISGLTALMTAMGGSMPSKTDGWFKNDKYHFSLSGYDKEEDDMFVRVVNANTEFANMTDREKAIISGLTGRVYGENEMRDFESNTPDGFWWDYEMPMTEGDMSAYIQMNGILGGMVNGYSSVDSSGSNVDADITVVVPPIFADRYKDKTHFENPMPHTIKIYGNQVVMEFFSQQGGPVTTKLYGTIDKIPLSDTIKVE